MTWTKQRLNNLFFFLGVAAVVVMLFTFDVSFVELVAASVPRRLLADTHHWCVDSDLWYQCLGMVVYHQGKCRRCAACQLCNHL